ncbi:MAG: PH domain-containing protein [Candidatus Paceibacterota bacterium]
MLIEKIEFNTDEEVLLQAQRHWFVLITQLSFPFTLAILPLIALILLGTPLIGGTLPIDINAYSPTISFLYAAWLLILWMFAFNIWTNHYLDILILTNERIILIDQKGLFHRRVASFRLERLQDLHVEVDGIVATFFDYGTVHAETAGHSEEEFRAYGMPRPRELKAEILKAADTMIDEYRARPRVAGDDV